MVKSFKNFTPYGVIRACLAKGPLVKDSEMSEEYVERFNKEGKIRRDERLKSKFSGRAVF